MAFGSFEERRKRATQKTYREIDPLEAYSYIKNKSYLGSAIGSWLTRLRIAQCEQALANGLSRVIEAGVTAYLLYNGSATYIQ